MRNLFLCKNIYGRVSQKDTKLTIPITYYKNNNKGVLCYCRPYYEHLLHLSNKSFSFYSLLFASALHLKALSLPAKELTY